MTTTTIDANCIFCKIAMREIAADVLHESDSIVAFRDTNPQAPVHILLIPKDHIASIEVLESRHSGVLSDLILTATHLAKAEGISESGWRLVTNVGPDAGQSVFHLHFHLLGGRPMAWPPG
jgi:histidine triad (HIT) family protein